MFGQLSFNKLTIVAWCCAVVTFSHKTCSELKRRPVLLHKIEIQQLIIFLLNKGDR